MKFGNLLQSKHSSRTHHDFHHQRVWWHHCCHMNFDSDNWTATCRTSKKGEWSEVSSETEGIRFVYRKRRYDIKHPPLWLLRLTGPLLIAQFMQKVVWHLMAQSQFLQRLKPCKCFMRSRKQIQKWHAR